jgi:hypothetical protein
MAVAAFLAPVGCSVGADEEPRPATGAPAAIVDVVERLERATAQRDWDVICRDLFTAAARERAGGEDCGRLLRSAADEIRQPSIEIRGIDVRGERATVLVRTRSEGQPPIADSLRLRREPDGWRVESLAGSG